jgi:hypothetical protein
MVEAAPRAAAERPSASRKPYESLKDCTKIGDLRGDIAALTKNEQHRLVRCDLQRFAV